MNIAIHALQALGPSAANLDENGFPKMIGFGDTRRGRISSQAQKRLLREWVEKQAPASLGIRTPHLRNRLFLPRLRELITTEKYREQDLDTIADLVVTAFAGELDKNGKLTASIFTWPGEVDLLAQLSLQHRSELLAGDKKGEQTAASIARAVIEANLEKPLSLAAFGRMIAALPEGNIDGAIAVAHAYTTHEVFLNVDNFTANDDLAEANEPRAFLLHNQPFLAPSVFYRHFSINTTLMKAHRGSSKAAREAVRLILEAFWEAAPARGKQRSYKSDEKPQLIVASVGGNGQSRGDAFMAPVRETDDILVTSIQRFDDGWRRNELIRRRPEGEVIYTVTGYSEVLEHLKNTIVAGGYDELIDKVLLHLEG